MTSIQYKQGYKYQLFCEYVLQTKIMPTENIDTFFIRLSTSGKMTIKKGYAWDGASGVAIDTINFMRGSLVHDALYQLMRMDKLNRKQWRKTADDLLFSQCIEDGMSFVRAKLVYYSVRFFGTKFAMAENRKTVLTAPRK